MSSRSRSQSSSSFINNNLGVTEAANCVSSDYLELAGGGGGGTMRRSHYSSHTLTKAGNSGPYRQKVLTNGSFLNLKESQAGNISASSPAPVTASGSDDGGSNSSRPTTSTEDDRSETASSGDSHQQQQQQPRVASVVNLKRSNTLLYQQQTPLQPAAETSVVLPPPETFGDNGHGGAYPIDTSTARAIIDTYSGNLFSRSTNYFSFRGDKNSHYLESASCEADSLEVQPATNNFMNSEVRPEPYGMEDTGLPIPHHHHQNHHHHNVSSPSAVKYNTLQGQPRLHTSHSMSKKTRTESVV